METIQSEIEYDRESGDFCVTVEGQIVGFAYTHAEAEALRDETVTRHLERRAAESRPAAQPSAEASLFAVDKPSAALSPVSVEAFLLPLANDRPPLPVVFDDLDETAPTLPSVGALCDALSRLAPTGGSSDVAKAAGRAAAAVVEGLGATFDTDGDLVIASRSETGRVHRVNAHGCTCRARGACWHTALWDAVWMTWDES